MSKSWVATLPMYNVTAALQAHWRDFLREVVSRASESSFDNSRVDLLEGPLDNLVDLWKRPDLLLSQTCGYPLMSVLPKNIHVVATPIFDANGCDGARYSSVLIVSSQKYAQGATTLESCRGGRAAYNDSGSNSGMNVFRHAVAPLAGDGKFFGEVVRTGSHLASLRTVARGEADITAVDCVTFAFAIEAWPELLGQLTVIGSTASSPGLPLIASPNVDSAWVARLRDALDEAVLSNPARARSLKLRGFARLARDDYQEILALERDAIAHGYNVLQ